MFSVTTRVMVRWARGLISMGDPGPEQFVEMAGVRDDRDARKLAAELLDAHKGERATTGVTGHVHHAGQQPGGAYYVGDRLGGMEVQSIAIGMDAERQTVVTPELGDPKAKRLDAVYRRIARASAGSTSEWASPWADRPPGEDPLDSTPPTFTYEFTSPAGST